LFIPHEPEKNASSRYRIYKYLNYLKKDGIEFDVIPPVSNNIYSKYYNILNSKGNKFTKMLYKIRYIYPKKLFLLFKARNYDVIFILRLNSVFEQLISKYNKTIFDFDDALFNMNVYDDKKGLIKKIIHKIKSLINGSDPTARMVKNAKYVIIGNQYLFDYAKKYNSNCVIIPTPLDLDRYELKNNYIKASDEPIIICWIGNPSNIWHLNCVKNVLVELSKKYNIILRVISSQEYKVQNLNVENIMWNEEKEVDFLRTSDIGIMPLYVNEYTKGKCGFKALQYMAVGLPVVATGVGINNEIVTNDYNGYIANNEKEWYTYLEKLILDSELRRKLGLNGHKYVQKYSVEGNYNIFKEILVKVYQQ
jgi:glycosyltransferase involved in cell wall biosynthesis